MKWYNVDFRRLGVLLTPPLLRSVTMLSAWVTALTIPAARLYTLFEAYRRQVNYKLEHNSQRCHLEGMLNDNFDYVLRRIYITDADVNEWAQFLWRESEDRPVMLATGEVYMLYGERYIGADAIDFVVHIPSAISLTADERRRMDALLRYYKLASKRYNIEFYE